MKIQHKDLFHGAALTQVVEHRSFKALNKAQDGKYGHYQVNDDRRLLFKHSKNVESPWQFTFQPEDVETLSEDIDANFKTALVLVCGTTTVCLLDSSQIMTVLDFDDAGQQWIRVKVPKGGSMHVSGKNGSLERTIPHNGFPDSVFQIGI